MNSAAQTEIRNEMRIVEPTTRGGQRGSGICPIREKPAANVVIGRTSGEAAVFSNATTVRAIHVQTSMPVMYRGLNDHQNPSAYAMLTKLEALKHSTEYDEDFLEPTLNAFQRMRDLLKKASVQAGSLFTRGFVYPDGDGGLSATWHHGNKDLRVTVPAQSSQSSYLWHMHNREYATDYNVTPAKLAERLKWLLHDRRSSG